MAVNIPLMILLRPLTSAIAKVALGTTVAALTYAFLNNSLKPFMDNLTSEIYNKVSELSTIGGTSLQVIQYLDFPHCISLILSTSAACFSIKVMSVALRAFGVNTG